MDKTQRVVAEITSESPLLKTQVFILFDHLSLEYVLKAM